MKQRPFAEAVWPLLPMCQIKELGRLTSNFVMWGAGMSFSVEYGELGELKAEAERCNSVWQFLYTAVISLLIGVSLCGAKTMFQNGATRFFP